ncbi:transposase [Halosquirtibacter xylanolyticus]|uniref:IS4 family transposase n=1 Tax=Halosquirtibacter xylanolyticus TaxID=3374599 RepID=UPI003748A3E4|nr:transposase [Prolixibacteraceae bacterium]
MLQNKSTKVFSETHSFFSSSEKGINRIISLYKLLNLGQLKLGVKELPQSTYFKSDILLGLLLFPIFSIPNIYSYSKHYLSEMLEAQKNTFYRFKNNSQIDWRTIVSSCNNKLFGQIAKNSHSHDCNQAERCLIIDDTDFEKSTYKTEHVSKIWSHVTHRYMFGFKGLFLGLWDGKSYFTLDFSLHKERGKNKKTPFGLTAKQRKKQFSKKRSTKSNGFNREKELVIDKITMAKEMMVNAIKQGITVDYILMDSWFFCDSILKTVISNGMHLVAMAKMSSAKYSFKEKEYSTKELALLLKQRKRVKWVKSLSLYCAEITVKYKGTEVKLFFCKNSKRGKWHLLVSSNTKLSIEKAYQIYSIRWSIEVFFKESKNYFGLGKSQSSDFDAQIADLSVAIIEFNVFSLAKRFEAYETLGGIFAHVKDQGMELVIIQRIWGFILELMRTLAEIIDSNFNELIINMLKNKPENNRFFRLIESMVYEPE